MVAIKVDNLTKQYKKKKALEGLTIEIPDNKIIGLIGRNGAGKTTFLKTCAGRIRQSSGAVNIFGEEVFDNLNVLSKIIFIDEESQYDTRYKVKELFSLVKCYYDHWDDDLANKLLNHFNLDDDMRYKKLSRGMRTQINVIIGICSRMPLTILDEPTLGLDAAVRKDFYNIILKDYISHPRTIIISSHLLNEIDCLLEEVILIDNGKLLLQMPMDDFREYAIQLNGEKSFLDEFVKGKEVINKDSLGQAAEYILKNELKEEEINILADKGVSVKGVSVQDLFIYMTSKGEMFDEFE